MSKSPLVFLIAFLACLWSAAPIPAQGAALRICADPDYLPYSNRAGQGFENKIAEAVAKALGEPLEYTWESTRSRGGFPEFLARTLDANKIDVLITWQPAIGAFLRRHPGLEVVPVPNARTLGPPEQYTFPMSMGVRQGNESLKRRLDDVIAKHQSELTSILAQHGVRLYTPQ